MLTTLAMAGLCSATPASAATTLVSPHDGSPVQGLHQYWVDTSLVPTPTVKLPFSYATCPTQGYEHVWGCMVHNSFTGATLYVSPTIGDTNTTMDTLRHEIAHVFDELYLTEADRQSFTDLIGSGRGWEQGADSPSERFAVAYALVARYSDRQYRALFPRAYGKPGSKYRARSLRQSRIKKRRGIYWESGYRASSSRHEQIRRFIQAVALKNHLG